MSRHLQSEIKKGSPIKRLGLTFYPIIMDDYEEFVSCKDALILRQSTLPAKYLAFDFVSAVFAYETELAESGKTIGLFERLMRLLYLSLRIGYDGKRVWKTFSVENRRLARITIEQLGNKITITPREFSEIVRPLIAEQNGLELPDEEDNADIIAASEQKKSLTAPKNVKVSNDDLIASVAYLSMVREKDVYEWTVREFEARRKAIDRDKRYTLYGQAEMGGMVTFKNGNPAPYWCYDCIDDTYGTIETEKLQKTLEGVAEQR